MTKRDITRSDFVYICDWLPPDFGAVGQYSVGFARDMANEGQRGVLIGLSSKQTAFLEENISKGHLTQIRLKTKLYNKASLVRRLYWTFVTNTRLLIKAWPYLRKTEEILFTGSPPLFLHWIAPANLLLRKRISYRITDFHPECLMAAQPKPSRWLNLVYKLTVFWRKRVTMFEVLGHDQIDRLREIGISEENIRLKPDPSPVQISKDTQPLERPSEADGKYLLLYSGNWGVAHDDKTFVDAYTMHHKQGSGQIVLWLNAVGAKASKIANELEQRKVPFVRGHPVPLEQLSSLLVTPDAHLITLTDAFVGYVLPSKVHGCIESGKPVLYVGSPKSDVHRLCEEKMRAPYHRVDVGDVDKVAKVLEDLALELCEEEPRDKAANEF